MSKELKEYFNKIPRSGTIATSGKDGEFPGRDIPGRKLYVRQEDRDPYLPCGEGNQEKNLADESPKLRVQCIKERVRLLPLEVPVHRKQGTEDRATIRPQG